MTELESGAQALIKQCLKLNQSDKVVIVSEYNRKNIAEAISSELQKLSIPFVILMIEDFISRPARSLPLDLVAKIKEFNPNVSIYAATAQAGELPDFRRPLTNLLTKELKCRHAHMVGIDENIFKIGMNQDYEEIFRFTNNVTELVRKASKVKVTCPYGTDITFDINNDKYKWIPSHGNISQPGTFMNLPDGETFTYPDNVNGNVVAWVLGDTLSSYGVLREPIKVEINNSYIVNVRCDNKDIEDAFKAYIQEYKDGNRVGELGIGTLANLKEFTGNLLLDEKFPGIHLAFGYPYPEMTNAEWSCPSHIDIIPKEVNIDVIVGGQTINIMQNGKFLKNNI